MKSCPENNNTASQVRENNEEATGVMFGKSNFAKLWGGKVAEYKDLLALEKLENKGKVDKSKVDHLNGIENSKGMENKYFCPEFVAYLTENLLPTIPLWSYILWGDPSRYNDFYHGCWSRNINENKRNGQVEHYFGLLKMPWERKLPIHVFIERKWERRIGFRR
eukprot:gene13117-14465_t